MDTLGFSLENKTLDGQKIEVTRWHASTSNNGKVSTITVAKAFFTCTIEGESLYCFKLAAP